MTESTGNPDIVAATDLGSLGRSAKRQRFGRVRTCERCWSPHIRCNYLPATSVCQRCTRTGDRCSQRSKTIRFRKIWIPSNDGGRSPESINRESSSPRTLIATDASSSDGPMGTGSGHTVTIAASHAGISEHSMGCSIHNESPWPGIQHGLNHSSVFSNFRSEFLGTQYNEHDHGQKASPNSRSTFSTTQSQVHGGHDLLSLERGWEGSQSSYNPPDHYSLPNTSEGILKESFHPNLPDVTPTSSDSHHGRVASKPFPDNVIKVPHQNTWNEPAKALEVHLLRYFHDRLAPWFDICDPSRHFTHALPQRAREPGSLRSALLTIAARDLSRNKVQKTPDTVGIMQGEEHWLSDVTEELAVSYHNDCIRELLLLSLEPEKLHDETLLAAVILLRTDEEMLHVEEDQQLFLRIANLFIDAQLPSSLEIPRISPPFHSIQLAKDNSTNYSISTNIRSTSDGLRQACYWTALRQDLHAAFLKQQPVTFPLNRCETFRQFAPASDAVWAHRMVVFCADVLEYCFGSESTIDAGISPAFTNRMRWQELRSCKEEICRLLPASFEPVYCCQPDASRGEVFPKILYLETSHVSGTTYVELATLLLEAYDPVRLKFAGNLLRPTKVFLCFIKRVLFRLCGIAVNNAQMCPPGLVNASLGIGLFGEFFEVAEEQNALLGVLSLMSQTFNYHPAIKITEMLRRAWFEINNDGMSVIAAD